MSDKFKPGQRVRWKRWNNIITLGYPASRGQWEVLITHQGCVYNDIAHETELEPIEDRDEVSFTVTIRRGNASQEAFDEAVNACYRFLELVEYPLLEIDPKEPT